MAQRPRIVPKFEGATISDPLQGRTPGPGGAVWRVAADALGGLARSVGQLADRAAVRAGEDAGTRAGMDPEFRPRRDGTTYGEAYDRAAFRTAGVELDAAITRDLAEAYDTNSADPAAFKAAADAVAAKRVLNLPPELQAQASGAFAAKRFAYEREIARTVEQRTREEQAAAVQGYLSTRAVEIDRMAYQLGLDEKADAALSGAAEETLARLLDFGPKEAFEYAGRQFAADPGRGGVLTVQAIDAQMDALNERIATGRLKGAFARAGGLAQRQAFLKEFRRDYAAGEGVAAGLTLDQSEQMDRWMEVQIREELTEARAQAALVSARVADIRSQLAEYRGYAAQGLTPPPGVLEDLTAQARATGNAALLQSAEGLQRTIGLARDAARASPVILQEEINRRRTFHQANGATPEQADQLGLLEDTLSGMTTALARDPMSWAARAGVIALEPVMGLNPQTGQPFLDPAALARRRDQAVKVRETYGSPLKLFTDEEAAEASQLEQNGGEALAMMAGQVVSQLASDAPAALAQLSDKAPVFAHLGGLLAGGSSPHVVKDAARGRALLAKSEGNVRTLTPAVKVAELQGDRLRLDRVTRLIPQAGAAIEQAADAIYLGRKGLASEFDGKAYQRAVQEAAGATFVGDVQFGGIASRRNSGKVLAPGWLRADRLDDVVNALTPTDLQAAGNGFPPLHEDGTPVSPRDVKAGRLVSIGPGRYWVAMGDPDSEDPRWLASADPDAPEGRYVLDLDSDQLRPFLLTRNPSWGRP